MPHRSRWSPNNHLARRCAPCAVVLASLGAQTAVDAGPATIAAARTAARRALCADLTACAQHHLADKAIPGIWLALLDVDQGGSEWSWSTALGVASPGALPRGNGVAAVDAVHRVASLGKLVTATMAMVLAERGELDLDAPVTRYLPDFRLRDERAAAITVRHLLHHKSGLSRDCPVGNWYDTSAPDLAAVVRSVGDTELLFAPGSAVAYSNPGYAVLGRVLEVAGRRPFAKLADELVLQPLGMVDSSFAARADLRARAAHGRMWTLDGRAIPTPDHEFGCMPAANLRSTTDDLLAFARSWLPASTRRVLAPAAQAAMWRAGETDRGIALGFFVAELDGAVSVGHGATAPGTAIELWALPDEGLVAIAVVGLDFANDVAEALVLRALRGMRAVRRGEALPLLPRWPVPVGSEVTKAARGRYGAGDEWFDLRVHGDDVLFDPCIGIASLQRDSGDGQWIADDPCVQGGRVLRPEGGQRIWDGYDWFWRRPLHAPAPPPDELRPLLGEYGWDHGGLIVYEDGGRLGTLLEWHVREQPVRTGPDRYEFPPGSFGGETLRFVRDADGRVQAAVCANVTMPRRADPGARGFRIVAQRAVAELRELSKHQRPPVQRADLRAPDLVPLEQLSPTLKFEIRYATADNFLGEPVYERAAPMLQRPAAAALLAVHDRLRELGYGLLVYDAYRPWSVTKVFWEATPPELRQFVADPAQGSRHNRGCAVDLTLYDLATGAAVDMPSGYDEFTVRAYPDWPGGTSLQRYHRELLRAEMEAAGFTVYEHEWWHFDFRDWQQYPVLDQPLR